MAEGGCELLSSPGSPSSVQFVTGMGIATLPYGFVACVNLCLQGAPSLGSEGAIGT